MRGSIVQRIGLPAIIIVIFSQVLHAQSTPSDISEDIATQIATISFPTSTPFSYNLIEEVTRFRFDLFLRDASNAGWSVRVWDAIEYRNIVHALDINTGEMLRYGDHLLVALANSNPNALTQLLKYFLTDEKFKGKKIIGTYLQNLFFNPQTKTVSDFVFIVRMDDDQKVNLTFKCDDDCNREVQEGMYYIWEQTEDIISCDDQCEEQKREIGYNLLYNQILSHSARGLFQSFEELLIREEVSQDSRLTLYLKDLSQTTETVYTFVDVERINIGIVVENSQGEFLKEIDWVIPIGELKLTDSVIWESITTPFYEIAHAVVRRALFSDMYNDSIYRDSILMRNGLLYSSDQWILSHGYTYVAIPADLSIETLMNSRDYYIKEMAIKLAALIADQLFFQTGRNYNREILEAQLLAFHGICSGMSMNISGKDNCPSFNDLTGFEEFLGKLPEHERQLWTAEANSWSLSAMRLAIQVLTSHFDVFKQLIDLILLNDTLNYEDIQNFYQNFTPRYSSSSGVFNDSEESLRNRSLSTLEDFGPDILNKQLASLFSLDRQRNLKRAQRSSIPNILSEVEKIENPPYTYLSVQGGPSHIQRNYSQGLPALYIRECLRRLFFYMQ